VELERYHTLLALEGIEPRSSPFGEARPSSALYENIDAYEHDSAQHGSGSASQPPAVPEKPEGYTPSRIPTRRAAVETSGPKRHGLLNFFRKKKEPMEAQKLVETAKQLMDAATTVAPRVTDKGEQGKMLHSASVSV